MPGSSQQKKGERERAAASCQKINAFLPNAKCKATGDGQHSEQFTPSVGLAEASAAAAEMERREECETSEVVAPDILTSWKSPCCKVHQLPCRYGSRRT